MKFKKWVPIAEIVASVAVVISLGFLIFEIRQNTNTLELELERERVLQATDIYLNEPRLAEIYAKVKAVDGLEPLAAAYVELYDLTPADAVLWARNISRGVWLNHNQFIQSGPSNDLERWVKSSMLYPDVRLAIELNEDELLTPEFIDYIGSIVGEN